MGVKISELPSATSLTGNEEIPIVQSGNTKKVSMNKIIPTSIFTAILTSAFNTPVANQYNTIPIEPNDVVGTTFSFDSTNKRIVATMPCKVLISATVQTQGNAVNIRIRKNGSDLCTFASGISGTYQITASNIYASLTTNDYIDIASYSASTTDKLNAYRFYMSVVEIPLI